MIGCVGAVFRHGLVAGKVLLRGGGVENENHVRGLPVARRWLGDVAGGMERGVGKDDGLALENGLVGSEGENDAAVVHVEHRCVSACRDAEFQGVVLAFAEGVWGLAGYRGTV